MMTFEIRINGKFSSEFKAASMEEAQAIVAEAYDPEGITLRELPPEKPWEGWYGFNNEFYGTPPVRQVQERPEQNERGED